MPNIGYPNSECNDPLLTQRCIEHSILPILLVEFLCASEDSSKLHILSEYLGSEC